MRLVEIAALKNGAHRNQTTSAEVSIPDGWAVIPDDMVLESFPFGEVTAEEVTYYRDVEVAKEVVKTREIETFDEEGNPVTVTEEYTETEFVTEQKPYTAMTVVRWAPGTIPEVEAPETGLSDMERIAALEEQYAAIEDALCEMDAANSASIAAIEDALCEMDREG